MSKKAPKSRFRRPTPEEYIRRLEISNGFSEQIIRQAIRHLGLFPGCEILDIPCGIGNHARWMLEENGSANVTGVDISNEHLAYANNLLTEKPVNGNISFLRGDITSLAYDDNSFDFIWCCNGLWIGDPDIGYMASEPYQILRELKRVTKPGGKIALIFKTSHKLLPGYPLLESALNATFACHFLPLNAELEPDIHIMRAPLWLKNIALKKARAKTFVTDVQGPFTEAEHKKMAHLLDMSWGKAQGEVTPEMWKKYQSLTDPDSDEYIFRLDGYAGFMTYTMYTGEVA